MDYYIPEFAPNVFAVGSHDWNRKLFDSLIPLPHGTSYNSYLIIGNKFNVLIDTVNPGFETELLTKVEKLIGLKNLHFLVMNHAEPDHASVIPLLVEKTTCIVVCSEKGSAWVENYYKVPKDRIKIVKEKDLLDIGGKTLEFIDAPWLHWPETMFTYLKEDKILFPCDFFGSHSAFGVYDSDIPTLEDDSKRYFAEIMMPFRSMGKKALEKLKSYDIRLIAPSHGPIHKNPDKILGWYEEWVNGLTKEKVVIVYASMWGSTEKMAIQLANTLQEESISVSIYNLAVSDIGEIAKDLIDARGIVLGIPTVLNHMHPLGVYAAHLVKVLKPPVKYGIFISSYGWAAAAGKNATDMLANTGIELIGALEVKGRPSDEDLYKVKELGLSLAQKIKS